MLWLEWSKPNHKERVCSEFWQPQISLPMVLRAFHFSNPNRIWKMGRWSSESDTCELHTAMGNPHGKSPVCWLTRCDEFDWRVVPSVHSWLFRYALHQNLDPYAWSTPPLPWSTPYAKLVVLCFCASWGFASKFGAFICSSWYHQQNRKQFGLFSAILFGSSLFNPQAQSHFLLHNGAVFARSPEA